MTTRTQLGFITLKITELETAVFHSQSNGTLHLNPDVIKTLKIDDNGDIWFLVTRPTQELAAFDKQFPVKLNYYRKGAPFFMNVFGVARIVTNPEELAFAELDCDSKMDTSGNKILLCVKIMSVNYYEKEETDKRSWLIKAKRSLMNVLIPDEDLYYDSGMESRRHFA